MHCVVDNETLEGRHLKIMLLTLTRSGASTPDGTKHWNYRWGNTQWRACMRADKRNYILSAKKKKKNEPGVDFLHCFNTLMEKRGKDPIKCQVRLHASQKKKKCYWSQLPSAQTEY